MNQKNIINVTWVTTGLGTGGAEMMLCAFIAASDVTRFRHSVISLTPGGKYAAQLEALGLKVFSLGMTPGRPSLTALIKLARALRSTKPDVISGWMYHGNLAALLGKWLAFQRTPLIWNVRQSLDSIKNEKPGSAAVIRLCARLSRFASAISYNSRASARHHEIGGYCKEKTVLIPNGFDLAKFVPAPEARDALRAELGLPLQAPLVGRFGRFATMKDHANFIQAAAIINEADPETHFIMVGTGIDGSNTELSTQISSLNLQSRLHLLGERQDIPQLTAGLDVACSSSAFGEGCPNVVGEAMACAVPCAVTDVGDSAWLAGDCGRVVPPRDSAALALAILELLHMPEPARRALGEASRQHIAQNFSFDSVIDRFTQLLARASVTTNPLPTTKPCAA
ncbi:MAG: glycosyltransferase [Verrucomicrobia bacterium]|nr:glycosyltransferase [Verrucomicrobiota bacterium]